MPSPHDDSKPSPSPSLFLPNRSPGPSLTTTGATEAAASPDPFSTDPSESPSPSPSDADPASSDELPDGEPDAPGRKSRSGPRFTVDRAKLLDSAAAAITTLGGLAHTFLSRDDLDRQAGRWLPTDDDVEGMADPLAGLASRRVPAAAGSADASDLLRFGAAFAGYVLRQWQMSRELRHLRAGEFSAADRTEHGEEPDPTPPAAAAEPDDPRGAFARRLGMVVPEAPAA